MTRTMIHGNRSPRHGVALVLVLVALAIGLLLTATWLDGRRESIPVAERVSDGTSARHAAASGLELAIATLDAEDDWRAAIQAGRFDDPFQFENATLGFEIDNADAGEPIDGETLRITIRSRAVVSGIAATCEGILEFEPENPVMDLDYGETGIIAEREIRILDRAAVLPWREQGDSDTNPIVLGTLDGNLDRIEIGPGSLLPSAELILVRGRRDSRSGSTARARELPDPLPAIASPGMPESDATPPRHPRVTRLDSAPNRDLVRNAIRIPRNATIEIEGDRIIRVLGDLDIEPGARLSIDGGTLHLDVERDVEIRCAEILVGPTGRLVLRTGRRLRIDDAFVGSREYRMDAADSGRMLPPGASSAAGDIMLTTLPEAEIVLRGNSSVTGTILAPDAKVKMIDESVLHGRIVAKRAELRDAAILYARPDDGRVVGLTSIAGPHRDEDGFLHSLLTGSDRGDIRVLQQIAEELGMAVCATGSFAHPSETSIDARAECVNQGLQRMRRDLRNDDDCRRMRWISDREGCQ